MSGIDTDKITMRRALVVLEGALREVSAVYVTDLDKMDRYQIARLFIRYISQTKQAMRILGGDPDERK